MRTNNSVIIIAAPRWKALQNVTRQLLRAAKGEWPYKFIFSGDRAVSSASREPMRVGRTFRRNTVRGPRSNL